MRVGFSSVRMVLVVIILYLIFDVAESVRAGIIRKIMFVGDT